MFDCHRNLKSGCLLGIKKNKQILLPYLPTDFNKTRLNIFIEDMAKTKPELYSLRDEY